MVAGLVNEPVCRDRAALVGDALVLADLHLGKGAAAGIEVPLGANADVVERVEGLVDRYDPREVVLAGDVLDAFDHVPDGAREAFDALLDACREREARPVVLRGNHDAMLESIRSGPVHTEYTIDAPDGDVVVCHGHEAPEARGDCYVIGHDHPAIVIEGRKRHCYLAGRGVYRGGDLLVLPAFNRLIGGVAVNGRVGEPGERSPLMDDIGRLRPLVSDRESGETIEFPPLGEFHRML